MSNRKIYFFIGKLILTGVVLYTLFSSIDVGRFLAHTVAISPYVFIVVSVLWLLATSIATIRWYILLRAENINIPFGRLLLYNFSYNFYSIALPGGKIGAEGIRLYQILKDNPGDFRAKLVVPTLLDRSSTLFVSLVSAILFFTFFNSTQSTFPQWFPYVGVLSIFLIIGTVLFPFERLFGLKQESDVSSYFDSLRRAIRSYRQKIPLLILVVALAVLMNATMALGIYLLTTALAIPASFVLIYFLFSVGMTSAFLPITIAWIGVREGVLAYLLSVTTGVTLEMGVSVSLTVLAASLVGAVFGACIELYRHFIRHES